MDLQEQRITCLRMAVDMGSKADSVFTLANNLMGFVTSGAVPSDVASPPMAASVDETTPPLSVNAPGPAQAVEPIPAAAEAVSGPEPAPAAAPPVEAQAAASASPAEPAGPVEAAGPADVPAAAEADEPVSAAPVAAPAEAAESAAQPEMSASTAANPPEETIVLAEAAGSAPTATAPLAEPIVAEPSAALVASAETTSAAGDAPAQGEATEAPPPESNGASRADTASAAPTRSE